MAIDTDLPPVPSQADVIDGANKLTGDFVRWLNALKNRCEHGGSSAATIDASQVISGTLAAARIPTNLTANITSPSGSVVLNRSGLFVPVTSTAGDGSFENANGIRWTSDVDYRTAIWRADASGSPDPTWHFDALFGDSVVIGRTQHTTRTTGAFGESGTTESIARTEGSSAEYQLSTSMSTYAAGAAIWLWSAGPGSNIASFGVGEPGGLGFGGVGPNYTGAYVKAWDSALVLGGTAVAVPDGYMVFGGDILFADAFIQPDGAVQARSLIGQGVSTGVSNLLNIPVTAAGPHFGSAFQIKGAPSGSATSYKVALYSAAETGTGSDHVYGFNTVVQRNAGATASNVIGLEINLNNNDADVALNDTPLVIGFNITGGGTKHMRSAMYVNAGGIGKWRKGIEFVDGSVLSTGIEIGGPTLGFTGTAVLRQLANAGDTVLLQRQTDTTPTGYLLRARDLANTADLFSVSVAGLGQFSQLNIGANASTVGAGNGILIGAAFPILDFYENVAGANLKRWRVLTTGGSMFVQTVDDAYSTAASMLTLERNGHGTFAGGLTFAGAEVYASPAMITPTTLSANTNNWNPTGLSSARVIWISSSAVWQLTGIAAQTTGTRITLINIGSFAITIVPISGSSSAGNQFITTNVANFTLASGSGLDLVHDGSYWRAVCP